MSARARACALGAAAVVCGALTLLLVLRPLTPWATTTTNDVLQGVVPLLVTVPCCLTAAVRSRGRRRTAWAMLAAGAASWGLGEVAWCWFELVSKTEPFPSVADVGFLGAVPLLLAGVVMFPAGLLRLGRARVLVDSAVIVTALLFAAAGTFLGWIWDGTAGTTLERALLIGYPASDVLVLAAALAILARRPDGLRGPLGLLIAGVSSLAVADCAFAWLNVNGGHTDPVTDVGWPLGFLLIGVAAHHSLRAGDVSQADVAPARSASAVEAWVPQLPVAVAAVVLAVRGIGGDDLGAFLGVAGAVVLLLAVARQALVQLENGELAAVLEHQAFHDPLTGLANRALFRNRLEHAASRRSAPGATITVLFVDLDDFKTVNDTMGHDVGDQLLVLVAERLRACVRSGDTAARLGGDEFAVLLDDPFPDAGHELGERILDALETPFVVRDRRLRVRASVGVVARPHGSTSADELLQDADLAMYAAKGRGGGRVSSWAPAMRSDAHARLELLGDLDGVLDRAELELHHQPVVRLATGEIAGHEVLLRWRHRERGMLTPASFLDLAEETGAVVPIGWWVLEQSCRRAAAGPADRWVSVNIAVAQLHEADAVERVVAALDAAGLAPARLVLEVTERALAVGDDVVGRLRDLRALGVRIALDDFGTGYSSLAALAGLPLDAIKIDGSFVARLDTDEGEALVRAVVELATALDLKTVAEGIEQTWQLEKVVELGCNGAQGYLLGRPSPVPAGAPLVRLGVIA